MRHCVRSSPAARWRRTSLRVSRAKQGFPSQRSRGASSNRRREGRVEEHARPCEHHPYQ